MSFDSHDSADRCDVAGKRTVLLYETVQRSASHAPFTRAFTQMVMHALPDRKIVVHAHPSHLRAAFAQSDPLLDSRVVTKAIADADGGNSILRTLHLLRANWSKDRPFVIFLTGQPHHIWAAKLFKRSVIGFRCQLVLHGDLNKIRGVRSRNPIHRMVDYVGSIGRANHRDVRFVALESHIGANLIAALPSARDSIDVVPHPCVAEIDGACRTSPTSIGTMRFGLLGIAGRSKGLDVFARIARCTTQTAGSAAGFRLIGKVQAGWRDLDLGGINGPFPISEDFLPRQVYEQELAELRYVILPYNIDYYALAASGVLLDVMRWRKPIIAFNTPVIDELIQRFGEIGHVCIDEAHMADTVRNLLAGFEPERYQRQRNNLAAAYRSRLPEAIATDYARLLRSRWGNLVADCGPESPEESVH